LEQKTQGIRLSQRMFCGRTRQAGWVLAGVMAVGLAQPAQAQSADLGGQNTQSTTTPQKKSKIGPAAPVTYDNKWELFSGLRFQNFQASQNFPKRMNLGGGEVSMTYWITPRLGPSIAWKGVWGTTPVRPNITFNGRAGASLNAGMVGLQYRGPKNQYAAVNYHAYIGPTYGKFDYTADPVSLGLYTNRLKGMAALGGSLDFNVKKNWAIRVAPELILENFGTEIREFVGVSGGVVWRIGKR
jgi:hypothetical protein